MYPFGEHIARMKEKHPHWTQRQCANCLYWQGRARKQLREKVKKFLKEQNDSRLVPLYIPEAMGVNVTATMKSIGIELEWPPVTVTYQVALVGTHQLALDPNTPPQGSDGLSI
jgi:hypothetical protein